MTASRKSAVCSCMALHANAKVLPGVVHHSRRAVDFRAVHSHTVFAPTLNMADPLLGLPYCILLNIFKSNSTACALLPNLNEYANPHLM